MANEQRRLARADGQRELDEAFDRLEQELPNWLGRRLRIGEVEFDVTQPKTRCLATHANPRTGERDLPVMETLVRAFGQAQPTFAVALMPSGRGGEIRVGDELTLLS